MAGPYYWVGGTGNWSDALHWSDSSGGLAGQGSTLVTNGTFTTDTSGWSAAYQSSLAAVGGAMVVTAVGGGNPYATQQVTVVSGSKYVVTVTATAKSNGTASSSIFIGSIPGLAATDLLSWNISAGTPFSFVVTATTTLFNIQLVGYGGSIGDTFSFDNISVRLSAVPDQYTDAHFDSLSNTTAYTVTVDATANCRDLMFDAAPATSGTITFAGVQLVNCYGNLKLLSGMVNNLDTVMFFYAATGTKTITTNGVACKNGFIFNGGASAIFQAQDDITCFGNGNEMFSVRSSTFDPNGKTVTVTSATPFGIKGSLTFYNLTRTGFATSLTTLDLYNDITVTNLFTATGNSTTNRLMIQSNTLGTPRTIRAAAVSLSNVDFMDITGAGAAGWGASSNQLTYSEDLNNAVWRKSTLTIGTGIADPNGGTTAFTLTATNTNSELYQPISLVSTVYVSSMYLRRRTGSGTVSIRSSDNTSWIPLTLTGSWSRFTNDGGTSGNNAYCDILLSVSGDAVDFWHPQLELRSTPTSYVATTTTAVQQSLGNCLGNSGITFTPAATQYWQTLTTGTKTWSTAANWFLGTNGTGGAGRVPLPQDNVVFDANSIGAASTTVSADMPRLGADITWTGVGNSPTFTPNQAFRVFGSFTLVSGMTFGTVGDYAYFYGRNSHTVTCAGKSFVSGANFRSYGGTYTLADAFTSGYYFGLENGTLTATAAVTTYKFFTQGAGAGVLNMGSGVWTITAPAGADYSFTHSNLSVTLNAQTSTVKFTDASSGVKVFRGAGAVFNNVWFSGQGPGAFQITGSNTFNDLRIDAPANVQFTAGTTTTLNTLTVPVAGGARYGVLPGVAGSYFSTPDSVASSVTGDIDLRAKATLQSWSAPTASVMFVGKFTGSPNKSFYFFANSGTGLLVFGYSPEGTSERIANSYAAPFSAGQTGWVRVTYAAATGKVNFYTSTDGASWTLLGVEQTVTAGTIYDSTAPVEVGALINGTANLFTGNIYRAQVLNGINGTVVVDFNPNDFTSGNTWTSSTTGEVWTRNGSALIYPEVKLSSTAGPYTLESTRTPTLTNYTTLGNELFTNGTFNTDTSGWSAPGAGNGGTITWSAGTVVCASGSSTNELISQLLTNLVVGNYYLVQYNDLSGELHAIYTSIGILGPFSSGTGLKQFIFKTTATSHWVSIAGGGANSTGTFDNISCKQVVAPPIYADYLNLSNSTVLPTNAWYAGGNSFDAGGNYGWNFGAVGLKTAIAVTGVLTASLDAIDIYRSTNFFGYTNTIVANWGQFNLTGITSGLQDPFGGFNAVKLIENSTTGNKEISFSVHANLIAGNYYTASIYVKPAGRNYVRMNWSHVLTLSFGTAGGLIFNVSNGTIFSQGSGTSAIITPAGNGWYRCSITAPCINSTPLVGDSFYCTMLNDSQQSSYVGDGTSGLYVYGPQLEKGFTPTNYLPITSTNYKELFGSSMSGLGNLADLNVLPAPSLYLDFTIPVLDSRIVFSRGDLSTCATRINSKGLIETVAFNVPRFDYDPVTLKCKGLLMELQATNLLAYSPMNVTTNWLSSNSSTLSLANPGTLPVGFAGCIKNTVTSGQVNGFTYQSYVLPLNTVYTVSAWVYVPSTTTATNPMIVAWYDNAGWVTISNLQITERDKWVRKSLTFTTNATYSTTVIGFGAGGASPGDATYACGAQLEAGPVMTSFIQTGATSATRGTDSAYIAGAPLNAFYNMGEGSFAVTFDRTHVQALAPGYNPHIVSISGLLAGYTIQFTCGNSIPSQQRFDVMVNSVLQNQTISSISAVSNTTYTAAASYNTGYFGLAVNGTLETTNTTGDIVTAVDSIHFGDLLNGHITKFAYYNKRLPDATLQALTTSSTLTTGSGNSMSLLPSVLNDFASFTGSNLLQYSENFGVSPWSL